MSDWLKSPIKSVTMFFIFDSVLLFDFVNVLKRFEIKKLFCAMESAMARGLFNLGGKLPLYLIRI